MGLLAVQLPGGVHQALPRTAPGRPPAPGFFRLLLHAVRRHISGSERAAVRGPDAKDPDRTNRRGDTWTRRRPHGRSRSAAAGGRAVSGYGGMHKRRLTKPDGRELLLYGRE